jgi:hypothetical protein
VTSPTSPTKGRIQERGGGFKGADQKQGENHENHDEGREEKRGFVATGSNAVPQSLTSTLI